MFCLNITMVPKSRWSDTPLKEKAFCEADGKCPETLVPGRVSMLIW